MVDLSRIECILFDLDGVLVDSRSPIVRCLNLALEASGLATEPEPALQRWIGHSLHEAFSSLLADRAADPGRIPELVERYRQYYRSVSLTETRSFPGVASAVRALARGHRLAVATSKPVAFAGPILEAVGLADAFAHIVGPPLRATHLEDKTGTLGRALRVMGVSARCEGCAPRAAMVGDRHLDVAAGRQHGVATVGVTWGIGGARELEEAGADLLVDTPVQLREAFC